MIDYLKYRLKLSKLFKKREKIRKAFANNIRRARKQSEKPEEIQEIESSAWFEDDVLNEEISILVTNYLVRKANRYFISIPLHKEKNMWEQCHTISNRYILTNAGIRKLRSSIRSEQKEEIDFIFKLLVALTGIIGALTGLAAILLK